MTSFHDIRFPLPLAFGASGGPQRTTEITTLVNGFEQRNTHLANSRRQYDAGVGIKSLDDLHTLIAFFEARHGELYAFRFRDALDFKSCPPSQDPSATDQIIGMGDGGTRDFQLVKIYADTAGNWQRRITKPLADTLKIAIDGQHTTGFVLDALTGVVRFDTAPAQGTEIRAGFEFDVPVRFATDRLNLALESFGAGESLHIPLIEVLENA